MTVLKDDSSDAAMHALKMKMRRFYSINMNMLFNTSLPLRAHCKKLIVDVMDIFSTPRSKNKAPAA